MMARVYVRKVLIVSLDMLRQVNRALMKLRHCRLEFCMFLRGRLMRLMQPSLHPPGRELLFDGPYC